MKKIIVTAVILAIFGFGANVAVEAADYPTKPIRVIVPYSPGGSLDVLTRAFASVAEKYLGQPLIVINKPGASGMIGSATGATAKPDGYTLTTGATSLCIALNWEEINGRNAPYRLEDFTDLGSFTLDPSLVAVPYDSPWKTLNDLIKACKEKPAHYRFGSGSRATWLPGVMLMEAAGITARHIPYNGGGPSLAATVGGHLDFSVQWPPSSIPLARGKKLRILVAMGDKRLKAIPDVPTTVDLGIKNAVWQQWIGYHVPKKTPKDIVEKLREVIRKVAVDESFIKTITTAGGEVIFMDGLTLQKRKFQESKIVENLFQKLVKEGAIKLDK